MPQCIPLPVSIVYEDNPDREIGIVLVVLRTTICSQQGRPECAKDRSWIGHDVRAAGLVSAESCLVPDGVARDDMKAVSARRTPGRRPWSGAGEEHSEESAGTPQRCGPASAPARARAAALDL